MNLLENVCCYRIIDLNRTDAPYISSRDMKDYKRESHPLPHRSDLDDNPVEKLTNKDDCSRLFEFDNDAPLIMENKDYREIVGLNRGTDDSRRTFAKPQSPDYMHDSGIGTIRSNYLVFAISFVYLF